MSEDAPGAFDKVVYHGKTMDKKTRAFIQDAEEMLGYQLTILQGCYNPGGVSQSAGTHDGGGVIDLAAFDTRRKLHVIKLLGGFPWYRQTVPGLWGEHIHFGIRNHGKLSPSAARQQVAYDNHRNGLANNQPDLSWRAKPAVTYVYDPKKDTIVPTQTRVTLMRDAIVEAKAANSRAISQGKKAAANNRPVADELEVLIRINTRYDQVLKQAPRR